MESRIAKNIKRIIREQGVKQYVIAQRAGYTDKQFSDMVNGRKIIVADDIIPIANALGCEPAELLDLGVKKSQV
ncbi:helix-turn-helix transcriptional regulator [[Clostridium] spiroforme]|nr:helix-turn-helix transcriptional regulator [Thomasclavelia spiroformis]